MRGLHTGAAIITVRPSDPVYKVELTTLFQLFLLGINSFLTRCCIDYIASNLVAFCLCLQSVPESRVRIVVVANLQLSPSVAYIMQHATVTYTVHVMKQSQAFGKGTYFVKML